MNIETDHIRVSDIVVREAMSDFAAAAAISLEASVENKRTIPLTVSIEAIALLEGSPLFVVSATKLSLGRIEPGGKAILSAEILHMPGAVAASDEVCVRVQYDPAAPAGRRPRRD